MPSLGVRSPTLSLFHKLRISIYVFFFLLQEIIQQKKLNQELLKLQVPRLQLWSRSMATPIKVAMENVGVAMGTLGVAMGTLGVTMVTTEVEAEFDGTEL